MNKLSLVIDLNDRTTAAKGVKSIIVAGCVLLVFRFLMSVKKPVHADTLVSNTLDFENKGDLQS